MKKKHERLVRIALGFTLIELMMVIVVIGILSSIVVVSFSGTDEDAKVATATSDLMSIHKAVGIYKMRNNGELPESLLELIEGPPDYEGKWSSLLTSSRSIPKDPWGEEYIYEQTEDGEYLIKTLGKDKTEGGDGYNKDMQYPKADDE